jgi:hypothetical protein
MTDILRNEVEIELAGATRTMRATFAAIRNIESALGKSMMAVIGSIGNNGDLSYTDAATIIFHGLRGNGDTRLTLDQVGEAIVEMGMAKISVPVVNFVSQALSGVSVGKPAEAPQ